MAQKGIKAEYIRENSPAFNIGLRKGDIIISVNGHQITDKLDFFFYSSESKLRLEWEDSDGGNKSGVIKTDIPGVDLGLEAENLKTSHCLCNCIFCFISQLPKGLRKQLYLKDEDYRLSFFHGNYITGVNLNDKDLLRIKKMRLSPLYLSIHATDAKIRKYMLGTKQDADPLKLLHKLKKSRIDFHTQIVLCPGINDGEILQKTISDLCEFYPNLHSIAVVPVGLTAHREKLTKLLGVEKNYAAKFLKKYTSLQREVKKKFGEGILFFSDEFYLLADKNPPTYSGMSELPQLENGVGMVADFYKGLGLLKKRLPDKLKQQRRIGAITSPLGKKAIAKALETLNKIKNLCVEAVEVENKLFGKSVSVTGLLSGKDILQTIKNNPGFDKFLIPGNAIKQPENLFLDDLSLDELINQSPVDIDVINGGIKEFFLGCIAD